MSIFPRGMNRTHDEIPASTITVPRQRRGISEAIKDALGGNAFDKAQSPSTKMAVALNAKNGTTYAGTVAQATIARRRAANKRARIARRAARR